jgi:hypothetical protein
MHEKGSLPDNKELAQAAEDHLTANLGSEEMHVKFIFMT